MFRLLRRLGNAAIGVPAIPGGLTGTFDLRGDAIIGWIDKIPYATNDGLLVEAKRLGKPIASCHTEPDSGGDRLSFILPLEGRFSTADLARETVTITVWSRRGDTGILKLEGATQLELVRAHLGLPVETILDLNFSRRGNAQPYLGQGWSGAEDDFTWTEGEDSLIHFESPTEINSYLLRMRLGSFHKTTVPMQRLDIYLNETLVADLTTSDSGPEYRELRIDGEAFALSANSTLRLHHPYAASPSEHSGNDDPRRLAFSFRRLSLVRPLDFLG